MPELDGPPKPGQISGSSESSGAWPISWPNNRAEPPLDLATAVGDRGVLPVRRQADAPTVSP